MKIIIALLAALFVLPAQARDFYGTASVGEARIQNGPNANTDVLQYTAGLGLKATDWASVEALYHEWDDSSVVNCTTESKPQNVERSLAIRQPVSETTCAGSDYRPQGYSASVVFGKDFTVKDQGLRPYLRAGWFISDHGGDGALAGLGLQWKMVRLEYQFYDEVTTSVGGDGRIQSLNLGIAF